MKAAASASAGATRQGRGSRGCILADKHSTHTLCSSSRRRRPSSLGDMSAHSVHSFPLQLLSLAVLTLLLLQQASEVTGGEMRIDVQARLRLHDVDGLRPRMLPSLGLLQRNLLPGHR